MTSEIERASQYIHEMEYSIEKIASFVAGLSQDDFENNSMVQDAVHMRLLTIGEAVNNLQKKCTRILERNPQIPWDSIRGMRNRIAHEYFSIKSEYTWNTVENDLPVLKDVIREMKNAEPELAELVQEIKNDTLESKPLKRHRMR